MATDLWKSYWYVCHKCDASIEVVSKVEPVRSPSCPCGSRIWNISLCQVREVATSGSL